MQLDLFHNSRFLFLTPKPPSPKERVMVNYERDLLFLNGTHVNFQAVKHVNFHGVEILFEGKVIR